MTWLDWYVRDRTDSVRALFRAKGWAMTRTSDGAANVLAAFGAATSMNVLEYSADPAAHAARQGDTKEAYEGVLLSGCLLPFLNGFIPVDRRVEKLVTGPGLGLILSRETADMLADAAPLAADSAAPDGGNGLRSPATQRSRSQRPRTREYQTEDRPAPGRSGGVGAMPAYGQANPHRNDFVGHI